MLQKKVKTQKIAETLVTKEDVEGKFIYYHGVIFYGRGMFKGYDKNDDLIWKGNFTGFGFGFGGSYGEGKTRLK